MVNIPCALRWQKSFDGPDRFQGEAEIDGRADMFAFGCVLCEMLAGKRAFTGETVLDTLHAIAREDLELDSNSLQVWLNFARRLEELAPAHR